MPAHPDPLLVALVLAIVIVLWLPPRPGGGSLMAWLPFLLGLLFGVVIMFVLYTVPLVP